MPVAALVVVDGATDVTARVALAHGARTCVAPANRGQGAAPRLGYQLTYVVGAEYIVTADAHGQYDTAGLPRLLAPIVHGQADFVTGSRIVGRNETGDRARRAGLPFLRRAREHADAPTGDRHIFRPALRCARMWRSRSRSSTPRYQSSELLISVMARGFRVAEVPMTISARSAGAVKKGGNLIYGSRYARVVFRTWVIEFAGLATPMVGIRLFQCKDKR